MFDFLQITQIAQKNERCTGSVLSLITHQPLSPADARASTAHSASQDKTGSVQLQKRSRAAEQSPVV